MARKPKIYGGSTKGDGSKKKRRVSGKDNLGKLMRAHRDLEDLLYGYSSRADFVYDDMDFSIEEFSDMTGADLEELLEDIDEIVRKR
ncbi:hypothetical protein [Acanthopleuribacter pedis]|uniref:Uncharacterized protein n=1 Tax=Acanthopleuribacter pedis TaxID=442870 RepID=A0A8J7U6W1_9BACT|nr:hypothetical protein [Acanthopleuribacter pedis]MBO1322349.1 hypothetical protein [Acanthopleuribacter pedis]